MSLAQQHAPRPIPFHPLPYHADHPPVSSIETAQRSPMTGVPIPQSTTYNGRDYSLVVEQQPVRARMCGFGDKDRRPITPPPCIRLIVKDSATGREVDISELNTMYYVLQVDLWSAEADRDVNVVRHSATSPSISDAVQSPYASQFSQPTNGYNNYMGGVQYNMHGQQVYQPPQSSYANNSNTRNLIGSLSASAFKLSDVDNKLGVFFILQDLSVRTEGVFRLKMNFVDVASQLNPNEVHRGQVSVLASTFSEPFQVFSAKKFPGVIESTELSKCFALQGIKIPIRRDVVKGTTTASGSVKEEDEDED